MVTLPTEGLSTFFILTYLCSTYIQPAAHGMVARAANFTDITTDTY